MGRIFFYLRYAWRNLSRSARWTTFGVFCIGAGVATVVALRTLGLAIGDSLVDNVRQNLHGDIRVSTESMSGGFAAFNFDSEIERFSQDDVALIEERVRIERGTMTAYSQIPGLQITRLDAVTVGRPQFVSAFLVDPATFPPTGEIRAQDPPGVLLSDLLAGDNVVVVSRNLADQNGIAVGDTVRVSGTEEEFTVTGIVATDIESGIQNLIAGFFGFAYLGKSEAETLGVDSAPTIISVALPDGTSDADVERVSQEIRSGSFSGWMINTRPDLAEDYAVIGDYIGRFIVIMGLGALLIGGVGIINTMLVMVGRRSNEIAALKTFGLKGRQVFWLFMSEAFLLGLMGSILGCVLGVGLSVIVNQYGEAFLQQGLRWRLYPEALAYGLTLGMVVTLVFGVLPILTANKIRPAAILRPNETSIPRAGVFHSLIAIALVILVIGGIAGAIIGDIPAGPRGSVISGVIVGWIGVLLTLMILGVLVVLFWLIVWVVSKLPAFGIVDLRLALRNLTARRLRTATTLMALAAGMFALSAITFVGVGTREMLQIQLSQSLGGNVLLFPLASVVSPVLAEAALDAGLEGIEGIQYRTRTEGYGGVLEAIDGTEPEFALPFNMDEEDMPARARRAFSSIQMMARITNNPIFAQNIVEGRAITPEDNGQFVMVLPDTFGSEFTNITPQIGSIVRVRMESRVYEFEVIGFERSSGSMGFTGQAVIPPGTLPSQGGFSGFTILQVDPARLNETLLDLSALPLVFTLDITFIDGFLNRIINQFAAIPTVVGLLSLLAAAVTMANTVSLATLERRRQIGILKAVGLKGGRVLRIMIIENVLIGLLGGFLGIGVSALMVAAMTAFGIGDAIPIPREALPLAIALVAASIAIALVSTFLSSGVAVRERVANVLRYE